MTELVYRPGRAELDPAGFRRRRRIVDLTLAIGVPALLIALWQVAASQGWVDRRFYPAPSDIVSHGRYMFAERDLWGHTWVSTRRILYGFAWGASVGVVLGVLMGRLRLVRVALEPMLMVLYTVPKLSLLPVFLIILGFRERPVIAVLAVTVFFFVWISTVTAVMGVPATYHDAARSFRTSRWGTFRHVVLPAAIPQIFVGLRIAAGVAALTLIGIEFVFAPGNQGVGYVINQSRQLLLPQQAYVGIVIAALIGVVFTTTVRIIGRLLTPWAPKDESTGVV
jgi:sulfonate transport system permease protein